jgi:hypothetical protein
MTNGETIVLVVFTLAPILALFGFIIYGLLRHSKETYSVLYHPQVFKTTLLEYFVSTEIFFAGFLTITGGFLFSAALNIK